ncbi:MAG: hypothetical protein WBA28_02815 [Microbacteriaceae bacterium]
MDDTYPVLLKKGVAAYLDVLGIGIYKSTGAYTPEETITLPGIVTSGEVPTTFDNCIVLSTMRPVFTGRADIETPIQVFARRRGTRSDIENFSETILNALNDKSHMVLNELPISFIQYRNGLIFERDTQGRYASNQTFYFRGRKPSH